MKVLRHSGEWSEQTEFSLTEGTKQNKAWKKQFGVLMSLKLEVGENAKNWCCDVLKYIRGWVYYILFVQGKRIIWKKQ